jgi:hypothetical protein
MIEHLLRASSLSILTDHKSVFSAVNAIAFTLKPAINGASLLVSLQLPNLSVSQTSVLFDLE